MDKLQESTLFYMPAEYAKHKATIMIWPKRPGTWKKDQRKIKKTFANIIVEIAENELLYLIVENKDLEEAKEIIDIVCKEQFFSKEIINRNIKFLDIPTDDAWARDTAPTFVINKNKIKGITWKFNAWGGLYDGLYKDYENDAKLATNICKVIDIEDIDAKDFVLEGGSIHTDGEGTILVTKACLLSKGRNPNLTKKEIEKKLLNYLGAKKVIWLERGIYNDETNEHVDNICAFISPAKVLLAWTDDVNDPQYKLSKSCIDILEKESDAKGRKIEVIKLPIPKKPICIQKEDLADFVFEAGEAEREVGERLAASYINFYICNKKIIMPIFNDENDQLAISIIKKSFKDRDIITINARDIILGGGNIHCLTQQIPEV